MKGLLLFIYGLVFAFFCCHANTWIGVSGGTWSVASNWSSGAAPVITDDVVFNTSVSVNIDVSPVSVNSLHILNNSTVIFSMPDTRNIRLYSTSSSNHGLFIESGSSLNFYASASGSHSSKLDMTFAAGVTGSIYGTLLISGVTGANPGPRLETYVSATNYGLLTVYNGGAIKIQPGGFNTSSSESPVATLTMLNGSLYEITENGGSFPAGYWEPTSLAKVIGPGANGPQFNGSAYGNLEWNCASQNNFSMGKSVSFNNVELINTNISGNKGFRITNSPTGIDTLFVKGNLTVYSNARLEIVGSNAVTAGNGGRLHIKGNVVNNGEIITTGITGTINEIEFNGNTNQNITNNGLVSGTEMDVIINNSSGVTLQTPLILPGNTSNSLQLTSGKIFTSSANLLTLIDNAGYTGGSTNSFIHGPAKKTGNDNFSFPVGKGSIYAPIGIVNVSGETAADNFTAEYLRANPQTAIGAAVAPGMDHTSYVEYWTLVRNNGAAIKKVQLDVHLTSFCFELDSTYVSLYNGTYWTNEGATNIPGPSSPPYQTGTLTSVNNINEFQYFTLITHRREDQNPLPVFLKSFYVFSYNQGAVINWELAACCSRKVRFEVQRSADKLKFETIGTLPGDEINPQYSFTDFNLPKCNLFYRLKITDYNGKIIFSRIVSLINGNDEVFLVSLHPSIIESSALLNITTIQNGLFSYSVTGMQGQLWLSKQLRLNRGSNSLPLSVHNLPPGLYILSLSGPSGEKRSIQFCKQ